MKLKHYVGASVIALSVAVAGCGGGAVPSLPKAGEVLKTVEAAPATAAAAVQTVELAPAKTIVANTESSASGDTRNIDDATSGLDKLKSYRIKLQYSWEGKNDKGDAEKGSLQMMQEYVAATKDQHMMMTGIGNATGADQTNGAFEIYQVGNSSYMYNAKGEGDQKCISISSGDQAKTNPAAMFKPSEVIGKLNNATLVQKGVTVNEVVADQYTLNEKDLGIGVFSAAKGDVWIAQDGGYVVKYVAEATGKTAVIGTAAEGTIKWDYSVEDVNKIESIQLPAECQASKPADDIPVPDNATEKGNVGKMITFKSSDAPDKLTEYYKQQLPARGWTAGEAALEGVLSFTKDNRALTVMITKDDGGGSTVLITETPAQK